MRGSCTVGLPAELLLNEQGERKFEGVTVRTAGAVDPVARTMRVEVDVKNPGGELLAGAYAQVRFKLTSANPGLMLPGNALLFRPDGVRAATVDANSRVKLLPVVLGTDYGTRVSIVSGLTGDERVILNPPDSIIDGAAVRIGRRTAQGAGGQGVMSRDARMAVRHRRVAVCACRLRGRPGLCAARRAACRRRTSRIDAGTAAASSKDWKPAQPADAKPRAPWWEIYGDPQLNALEEQVATANQTVAAAAARFRGARAAVAQARSAYFPTVTANAAFNQSRASSNVLYKSSAGVTRARLPDRRADLLGAGPVGPHLARGRRRPRGSAGERRRPAKRDPVDAGRTRDQLLRIARHGGGRAAACRDRCRPIRKALALTKDRFAGGIAAESDVAQAEEQLKSTQAQLIDLETTRNRLVNAIAILIGEPPSTFTLDVAPLNAGNVPNPGAALDALPLGIPSTLLERRPDIAAAERRVAEANARVGVATAAFFPNLLLAATGGLEATHFSSWLMAPSRFWSLGPQLAFTVLDFGGRAAARDAARAAYDESVADYRQTVLTAFGQVEDNLNALAGAAARARCAARSRRCRAARVEQGGQPLRERGDHVSERRGDAGDRAVGSAHGREYRAPADGGERRARESAGRGMGGGFGLGLALAPGIKPLEAQQHPTANHLTYGERQRNQTPGPPFAPSNCSTESASA